MRLEQLMKEFDKSRMVDLITAIPNEFKEYYGKYAEVELPTTVGKARRCDEWRNIVVAGMGGSAIVGDLIKSLLCDKMLVPLEVVRGFAVPSYVKEGTLFVAVSYSGNTAETLKCVAQASERGAYLVAITSGGLLSEFAEKVGAPLYRLPPGRPPRTAVAPMLAAALRLFEAVGMSEPLNPNEVIGGALKAVEEFKRDPSTAEPVVTSFKLAGKIAMIYSYEPYAPIGYRFKTQINENAKLHAFFAEFPEADHNEIMGWEGELNGRYHVVFIRGSEERREVGAAIEFWKEILSKKGVDFVEIKSTAEKRVEAFLELLVKVDLTSYVLALLSGRDPTPVTTITKLKRAMEEQLKLKHELRKLLSIGG